MVDYKGFQTFTYPGLGVDDDTDFTEITDWAVLGLGTWTDDAAVTLDGTTVAFTDFESDGHGWQAGPRPAGTRNRVVGWARTTEEFEKGAVVGTTDTVYIGFGFEGLAGAAKARRVHERHPEPPRHEAVADSGTSRAATDDRSARRWAASVNSRRFS